MVPVALVLADLFQTDEAKIYNLIGFLAAMHDEGKCHPSFQVKWDGLGIAELLKELALLQSNYGEPFRHGTLTYGARKAPRFKLKAMSCLR